MPVGFNSSENESLPSHLLDELARVYARAAARAYFEQMMRESRSSGSSASERERLECGADLAT